MTAALWIGLAVALVGSGGLVGLLTWQAASRKIAAEAVKVLAEAKALEVSTLATAVKVKAETDAIQGDDARAWMQSLQGGFTEQQKQIATLMAANATCEATLAASLKELSTTKIAAIDATTAARLARAEIVVLHDQLDRHGIEITRNMSAVKDLAEIMSSQMPPTASEAATLTEMRKHLAAE